MTETEQRYAQIEKECLVIVFACEKFNHYILGRCANIQTINQSIYLFFRVNNKYVVQLKKEKIL